ncbi:MAG: hypothetical protein R3E57_00420 [Porticoccaceae bacterium]
MSEKRYEVVFRGDVVPGQSIVDVKGRLAELFNAESSRIDNMFSGRPVVIKRNVDQATAQRYQDSLCKAGAVVEIRKYTADTAESPTSPTTEAVSSATPELPDPTVDVAPVGADVLTAEYRRDFTPANIDTTHLSVAETGADVLRENEKQVVPDREVDTSHLSIKSD